MRAPLSWLREHAALPDQLTASALSDALISAGLEVETVDAAGADITGPVVVGRVLSFVEEPQSNGKTIRWCRVDCGDHNPEGEDARGIVCGARNFAEGDLVVVSLPGSVLPGEFAIAARKTYGHVSDGMICSVTELGLPDDGGDGILILAEGTVGELAVPLLGLRDDVLDIAVSADRGYCLSIRGLAREAANAQGVEFSDPVDHDVPAESSAGHPVRREAEENSLFVAVTVTGVDPTRPSPRWLARRLQLAGMRPISLAVDITNHVMLETGQPLHGYDADKLSGAIVVRHAAAGEKITTLDEVQRTCDPADLLITDDSGPIGLAGVMGGASTELGPDSSTVVIEAAHFDAMTIARTSRRHKLSSEASRRFERGVDPNAAHAAAHRAADLLVELAGGTKQEAETISGTVSSLAPVQMEADLPSRILGTEVPTARVVSLLTAIGARVDDHGSTLEVTPPTWRPDLTDPYDLIEEVGRQVGLDTIEPRLPVPPPGRGLTRSQQVRRALSAALPVAGFTEVISFGFMSDKDLAALRIGAEDERRRTVRLVNPLSETKPYLRTTLLPGLFEAVLRNTSRSTDDLALYEVGSVFHARPDAPAAPRPPVDRRPTDEELAGFAAALPDQPRHAAAVLTGSWQPAGWAGPAIPADWTHAVRFVEAVAGALGVVVQRTAAQQAPWHPGRCAAFTVNGTVIGHAGELHPSVVAEVGLPAGACAAEIDLDALAASAPRRGDIAELVSFPVAKEDVALVVDTDVPAAAVEQALRDGAGELLESVRLFDVYTGDQLAEGKKSLAYALRFRADRTLTDGEAAQARDAAVAEATRRHGAEQRV
ncbi:phenylalanine--tRNA ligase subunit beta [Propionibacteriaceae bacterium Y1700]|uniref:phenylalanine--tRNA ligase subunit beta n=1 Tax=Microlunatus sp. Y1700 TaxID=3418487 RepID=UPI003DA765C7